MKEKYSSQKTGLKWLVMFALVFALSIPVTAIMCMASSDTYRVNVAKGYLALRTAKAYDVNNEIGELYTGELVEVCDYSDPQYWYVYSSKLGTSGYVNKDYLIYAGNSDYCYSTFSVRVDTGYLALRTAMAYDSRNEIGELYTGDTVDLVHTGDGLYWYVYSPKHNLYGYVNSDYLVGSSNGGSNGYIGYGEYGLRTVSVAKGYLALRTAKAYDERNEIGELYTGDIVYIKDASDSQYWYVYSPKHRTSGYVNKDYLVGGYNYSDTKTVSVATGYLALRTAMAYDERNEIGELYTGDTVQVISYSSDQYWYVYSPKYNCNGYVNKDYLY